MILAFSNAGDAFSLDNLIRAFREDWRVTGFAPKLSAPWAQRWYQLQLTFVYCHTFFAKLSGKHWVDGWAVYFASRYDDCQRFMLPIIYDNPFTVKLLSWYTLVIEFLLWTFVWFRDTRYWILLGGLFLHFGIETTMNLPLFEWIFMSSYLAFVYPEDLTRVMDVIKVKVHKYFGEPVILAFDGHDGSAVCAAGVLHRMDIFGFMNLIDFRGQEFASRSSELDGAVHRLYLENKEGWLTSFVALQWMALRLPLLWFLLAFLYIPPLSWLGRIACDWLVRKTRTTIADEQLTPISQ